MRYIYIYIYIYYILYIKKECAIDRAQWRVEAKNTNCTHQGRHVPHHSKRYLHVTFVMSEFTTKPRFDLLEAHTDQRDASSISRYDAILMLLRDATLGDAVHMGADGDEEWLSPSTMRDAETTSGVDGEGQPIIILLHFPIGTLISPYSTKPAILLGSRHHPSVLICRWHAFRLHLFGPTRCVTTRARERNGRTGGRADGHFVTHHPEDSWEICRSHESCAPRSHTLFARAPF